MTPPQSGEACKCLEREDIPRDAGRSPDTAGRGLQAGRLDACLSFQFSLRGWFPIDASLSAPSPRERKKVRGGTDDDARQDGRAY